jgi:hypothetical protein
VAGSRVLGPIGLGQAALATVAGTAAGVVLPSLARRRGWTLAPLMERFRRGAADDEQASMDAIPE